MLNNTINFWESMLKDRALLGISTAVFVEQTIQFLKQLQEIQSKDLPK